MDIEAILEENKTVKTIEIIQLFYVSTSLNSF